MDTLVFWFLVLFLIVAVFPIATWVSLARAYWSRKDALAASHLKTVDLSGLLS